MAEESPEQRKALTTILDRLHGLSQYGIHWTIEEKDGKEILNIPPTPENIEGCKRLVEDLERLRRKKSE